jgi:hypothetical protein
VAAVAVFMPHQDKHQALVALVAVVVAVELYLPLREQMEQQIRAVVLVEVLVVVGLAVMAALALLFFPYQQPNTQAQPQEAQLSRQAVQTQF